MSARSAALSGGVGGLISTLRPAERRRRRVRARVGTRDRWLSQPMRPLCCSTCRADCRDRLAALPVSLARQPRHFRAPSTTGVSPRPAQWLVCSPGGLGPSGIQGALLGRPASRRPCDHNLASTRTAGRRSREQVIRNFGLRCARSGGVQSPRGIQALDVCVHVQHARDCHDDDRQEQANLDSHVLDEDVHRKLHCKSKALPHAEVCGANTREAGGET